MIQINNNLIKNKKKSSNLNLIFNFKFLNIFFKICILIYSSNYNFLNLNLIIKNNFFNKYK